MPLFIALRSTHHELQEARIFSNQDSAFQYAIEVVMLEGFEPKDYEGKPWLGSWGDDDGCGVIIAPADVEDPEPMTAAKVD
ncbi:MAG: hypothetical protein AB7P33_03335 [Dehalococcoidia bacterium]